MSFTSNNAPSIFSLKTYFSSLPLVKGFTAYLLTTGTLAT
jgi:hypothetical protein